MDTLNSLANSDVIFTTYFTSKNNPQRGPRGQIYRAPANSISYIYPWYATICHLNLNGVVIHDGLSADFIEKYENKSVKFYQYTIGPMSLNDERYFALHEILNNHTFKTVLITDASDLFFKKNPFDFIVNPNLLYVGTDEPHMKRVRENSWCMKKLQQILRASNGHLDFNKTFLEFEYANAGVIGGDYKITRLFTESLVSILKLVEDEDNHNMMAVNYLLWKSGIPHFKGEPFTSPFKRYALDGDFFIVHK